MHPPKCAPYPGSINMESVPRSLATLAIEELAEAWDEAWDEAWTAVRERRRRARSRRELAMLDEFERQDIGYRADLEAEAAIPFRRA